MRYNNNEKSKKYTSLARYDIEDIDYKNIQVLQRFVSSYGKIVPRRKSGVTAKFQRQLAQEIKRARFLALLPYTTK